MLYQGHGSSGKLAGADNLLDSAEAGTWTGTSVVYLSTCWGAYIQHNTDAANTIAETLLRSPGGSPAVIGSSASCSQDVQAALVDRFLTEALRGGVTLGDALVTAQRDAAARAEQALSDEVRNFTLDAVRSYVLLGDPALPLIPGGQ